MLEKYQKQITIAIQACEYLFYGFLALVGFAIACKIGSEILQHPYRTVAVIVSGAVIVGGIKAMSRFENWMES